jgi:hypothetical protein
VDTGSQLICYWENGISANKVSLFDLRYVRDVYGNSGVANQSIETVEIPSQTCSLSDLPVWLRALLGLDWGLAGGLLVGHGSYLVYQRVGYKSK